MVGLWLVARGWWRDGTFQRLISAWLICLMTGLSVTMAAASTAPATPVTLSAEQEKRVLSIQQNLRCPLCDTGESIKDSRSDISIKMRSSVREQVAAGKTDAEIYSFFAQRYGNFVLLDPPKLGRNLLLWGAPILALAGGGLTLWWFMRRRNLEASRALPAAPVAVPQDAELFDTYLQQVQRETRRADQYEQGGNHDG